MVKPNYIIQVIAIIMEEKSLYIGLCRKATTYIKDLAKLAQVLLITTNMIFAIGWLQT
jgi:hypothetical protein